jgi:hypothetical protein
MSKLIDVQTDNAYRHILRVIETYNKSSTVTIAFERMFRIDIVDCISMEWNTLRNIRYPNLYHPKMDFGFFKYTIDFQTVDARLILKSTENEIEKLITMISSDSHVKQLAIIFVVVLLTVLVMRRYMEHLSTLTIQADSMLLKQWFMVFTHDSILTLSDGMFHVNTETIYEKFGNILSNPEIMKVDTPKQHVPVYDDAMDPYGLGNGKFYTDEPSRGFPTPSGAQPWERNFGL